MKNKKGFTLTELIVVIAIIGILSAILIPAVTGYITKAREARAKITASEYLKEQELQEILDGTYGDIQENKVVITEIIKNENTKYIDLLEGDNVGNMYLNTSSLYVPSATYMPGSPIHLEYPTSNTVAYFHTSTGDSIIDFEENNIVMTTADYVYFPVWDYLDVNQKNEIFVRIVFKEGENITGLAVIRYQLLSDFTYPVHILKQMTFPKTSNNEYQNITDADIEELYNQIIN